MMLTLPLLRWCNISIFATCSVFQIKIAKKRDISTVGEWGSLTCNTICNANRGGEWSA